MVTFFGGDVVNFRGVWFWKRMFGCSFQRTFSGNLCLWFFSGGVFSSLFLILIVEKKHLTTKNLNHTLILQEKHLPTTISLLQRLFWSTTLNQQITWEILPVPQDGSVWGTQTWKLHLSDETKPWSPAWKITTCRYTNCKKPNRSNPLYFCLAGLLGMISFHPQGWFTSDLFFWTLQKASQRNLKPTNFLLGFHHPHHLMVPKAFPIRPVVPLSNLQVPARTIRLMRVNGGHQPWCRCSPRETSCWSDPERCASKMMDPR